MMMIPEKFKCHPLDTPFQNAQKLTEYVKHLEEAITGATVGFRMMLDGLKNGEVITERSFCVEAIEEWLARFECVGK